MLLTFRGFLKLGSAMDLLWIRLQLSLKNLIVVRKLCRQLLCLNLCLTVVRLFMLAMTKGGEQICFRRTKAPFMYCIVSAPTNCRLTIRTFRVLVSYTVPTIVRRLRRRTIRLLGPVLLPFLGSVLATAIAMFGFASGSRFIGVDSRLMESCVPVTVAFLRRPASRRIRLRSVAIWPRWVLMMVVCRVRMLPSVLALSCKPAFVVAPVSVVNRKLVTLNIAVVVMVY